MTTWFTSDTHFSHANILRLSNRPFRDIQHHDEMLVKNWNDRVMPNDQVYHLGDFNLGTFTESIEFARRLTGRKTLVIGNHDRLFINPDKNVEKQQKYMERFRPIYEDVFDHVQEGTAEKVAEMLLIPDMSVDISTGKSVVSNVLRLSHFPYENDSHDSPRFADIRPTDDGKVLVHGHSHQTEKVTRSAKGTLQISVGVDAWDYRPVALEEVLALISENS